MFGPGMLVKPMSGKLVGNAVGIGDGSIMLVYCGAIGASSAVEFISGGPNSQTPSTWLRGMKGFSFSVVSACYDVVFTMNEEIACVGCCGSSCSKPPRGPSPA